MLYRCVISGAMIDHPETSEMLTHVPKQFASVKSTLLRMAPLASALANCAAAATAQQQTQGQMSTHVLLEVRQQ
jgi:hypothetical protein